MIVLRVSAEKRPGTTHWQIVGCEINLHFWLHAGLDEGFSLPPEPPIEEFESPEENEQN